MSEESSTNKKPFTIKTSNVVENESCERNGLGQFSVLKKGNEDLPFDKKSFNSRFVNSGEEGVSYIKPLKFKINNSCSKEITQISPTKSLVTNECIRSSESNIIFLESEEESGRKKDIFFTALRKIEFVLNRGKLSLSFESLKKKRAVICFKSIVDKKKNSFVGDFINDLGLFSRIYELEVKLERFSSTLESFYNKNKQRQSLDFFKSLKATIKIRDMVLSYIKHRKRIIVNEIFDFSIVVKFIKIFNNLEEIKTNQMTKRAIREIKGTATLFNKIEQIELIIVKRQKQNKQFFFNSTRKTEELQIGFSVNKINSQDSQSYSYLNSDISSFIFDSKKSSIQSKLVIPELDSLEQIKERVRCNPNKQSISNIRPHSLLSMEERPFKLFVNNLYDERVKQSLEYINSSSNFDNKENNDQEAYKQNLVKNNKTPLKRLFIKEEIKKNVVNKYSYSINDLKNENPSKMDLVSCLNSLPDSEFGKYCDLILSKKKVNYNFSFENTELYKKNLLPNENSIDRKESSSFLNLNKQLNKFKESSCSKKNDFSQRKHTLDFLKSIDSGKKKKKSIVIEEINNNSNFNHDLFRNYFDECRFDDVNNKSTETNQKLSEIEEESLFNDKTVTDLSKHSPNIKEKKPPLLFPIDEKENLKEQSIKQTHSKEELNTKKNNSIKLIQKNNNSSLSNKIKGKRNNSNHKENIKSIYSTDINPNTVKRTLFDKPEQNKSLYNNLRSRSVAKEKASKRRNFSSFNTTTNFNLENWKENYNRIYSKFKPVENKPHRMFTPKKNNIRTVKTSTKQRYSGVKKVFQKKNDSIKPTKSSKHKNTVLIVKAPKYSFKKSDRSFKSIKSAENRNAEHKIYQRKKSTTNTNIRNKSNYASKKKKPKEGLKNFVRFNKEQAFESNIGKFFNKMSPSQAVIPKATQIFRKNDKLQKSNGGSIVGSFVYNNSKKEKKCVFNLYDKNADKILYGGVKKIHKENSKLDNSRLKKLKEQSKKLVSGERGKIVFLGSPSLLSRKGGTSGRKDR